MRLKSGARRFCSVVDGLHVRPPVIPALARRLDGSALSAVGGRLPVPTSEFAARAYRHALDPLRNPLKEVMDAFTSVWAMPPMLGIFNDIAADKMREDEVKSWARAGFTWVVNDGEHSQIGGRATHETNAMLLRNGLLPIQRLHREAISEHGDAFQLGARATMRPYASTYEEAEQYYRAIRLPSGRPGTASPDARGGFPVRLADRQPTYTPAAMRAAEEAEVQGWLQFETGELILDTQRRNAVLDHMAEQGRNTAVGFIGPFDAVVREGSEAMDVLAFDQLISAAATRGVPMGRVCGASDPEAVEAMMVRAITCGCRLISVHHMTSDLPFIGAQHVAAPFFRACDTAADRQLAAAPTSPPES